MGSVGHLCGRAEDQGSVQGQRHPRQQRDPHELVVHAISPAWAHHAARAGLFHRSLRQEQVWLLPNRGQRQILLPVNSEQNSKHLSCGEMNRISIKRCLLNCLEHRRHFCLSPQVYYILSRCSYISDECGEKDKKGIKRLLNNSTYTAAFPLHDVSLFLSNLFPWTTAKRASVTCVFCLPAVKILD